MRSSHSPPPRIVETTTTDAIAKTFSPRDKGSRFMAAV
jgi:hypothetical protein